LRTVPTLVAWVLLALSILMDPAWAGAVTFSGSFTQGGLVVGRTVPGSKVTLDGKSVRVSAEGLFLLGFGREAKKRAILRLTFPDGTVATQRPGVKQRTFKIQRIQGLPPKKVTPPADVLKRIRAENGLIGAARKRDTDKAFFAGGFVWPVRGRLSGVYGSQRVLNGKPRSPHGGMDIAAPTGTVVAACGAGIVSLVHQDMFYTGKTVMIDHGHGLASVYIHMSGILVKEGQRVATGTPIGKVGMTGRATGPHLHWGVSLFKTRLDPALLVGPINGGK
jgi:murein DD-endopeptidase MepM/ murein hydrolase activator NlpD